MASEVFDFADASGGAGYYDHNNAYYDGNGRGNEAGCDAERHCQKFQCSSEVLEMQVS